MRHPGDHAADLGPVGELVRLADLPSPSARKVPRCFGLVPIVDLPA